jgi:heat shock protein 90kDa beta
MLTSGDQNEEREKEIKQEYSQTCDWIKKRLGDKVARVDISNRLSSSPCVLVAAKFGWSANMERYCKSLFFLSVVSSLVRHFNINC